VVGDIDTVILRPYDRLVHEMFPDSGGGCDKRVSSGTAGTGSKQQRR